MPNTTPFPHRKVAQDPVPAAGEDEAAAPHPEAMWGTVDARFGDWARFRASGRTTPAGVLSVAILACAVFIPLLILARRR